MNAACGEECDPPQAGTPECNYICRTAAAEPLGTRHFSFGGALYSSALGTSVPLGLPEGALDLVGRRARLPTAARPSASPARSYFSVPDPRRRVRLLLRPHHSCTGHVYCDGGAPADVLVEQDSAGPGKQGNPVVTTTGLGADGGPGTVVLTCDQSTIQVNPPAPTARRVAYPADQPSVYTTGSVTGDFLNGDPRIGTGQITVTGEPFVCCAVVDRGRRRECSRARSSRRRIRRRATRRTACGSTTERLAATLTVSPGSSGWRHLAIGDRCGFAGFLAPNRAIPVLEDRSVFGSGAEPLPLQGGRALSLPAKDPAIGQPNDRAVSVPRAEYLASDVRDALSPPTDYHSSRILLALSEGRPRRR